MKIDLKYRTILNRKDKLVNPPKRIRASGLDKLMYYSPQFHDGQCRCVIRFDGKIEITRLTRAVELSLIVAPILSYRFVYHPWQSRWKKENEPKSKVPFRYIETCDPDKETCRFLAESMNPKQGIQVSVCLVRSAYDSLCIKLSHLVADAMGLLDYVHTLSNLYNQLQIDPEYFPQEPPEYKRGLRPVLRDIGICTLAKGFCHWCYPKSEWGFPQINSDYSEVAFPFRLISKDRLNRVKAICHEKGVKFTDVITAAFYQSLIDILNPRPDSLLSIQMTVNLRSYLPSTRAGTICNMTGAYYPVIRYTNGKSFDQTLHDVVIAASTARERKSWFGAVVFLELLSIFPGFLHSLLARHVIKRDLADGTSHPFFSNLGVIDPSILDFGNLKVDNLGLFGPVSYPPNFLVTVYSFMGKMYLNSSYCPSAADPKLLDRFFDRFLNYLPA